VPFHFPAQDSGRPLSAESTPHGHRGGANRRGAGRSQLAGALTVLVRKRQTERAGSPLVSSWMGGAPPVHSTAGHRAWSGEMLRGPAGLRERAAKRDGRAGRPLCAESYRQGLISADSWRPVPARAPRPNSMAIVRRPLCSGGGHFLQGRAGGGRQETKTRRPVRPGVLSRGFSPVRGVHGGWVGQNVPSLRSEVGWLGS
jgi:hypothetical protein